MNTILSEIYSTIIPSAPYIIAAYALVILIMFAWLFVQFRKQASLSKQLIVLEEELQDKARRANDADAS